MFRLLQFFASDIDMSLREENGKEDGRGMQSSKMMLRKLTSAETNLD